MKYFKSIRIAVGVVLLDAKSLKKIDGLSFFLKTGTWE